MKFVNVVTYNNRQYRLELSYYDGPIIPGLEDRGYLVSVACWIDGLGKLDAKISPMTKETAIEFIFREDNEFIKNLDKKATKVEQSAIEEGLLTIPPIDRVSLN